MILYIGKSKDTTRKLLDYSKVTEYKINIKKLIIFPYIDNENAETEIRELIPFTVATKITKYLGIN